MAHSDNAILLSGSTNGKPIVVTASSAPGTVIHQVTNDTTQGVYHQLFLNACNIDTASHLLTLEMGGTTTSTALEFTIGAQSVLTLLDGENLLNGGIIIKAHADVGSKINVWGRVNEWTRPNKDGI